ncbi:PQQ-binding-like beta-propeller repeat protein [Streptomyces sp. NPDC102274]|uniref:serine/threonine-protein kinase n=1 Tax=Streptomyces sp. NPDC102274 TaxID=3366151 RepID=UPI0038286B4C
MEDLGAADPRQVGPYTLIGRLGAGGMGSVYLGRSAGGRTVAVKVAQAELAQDPGFRTRFAREVAAARMVSGAFTAAVVDADPRAEVPWMATAFVVGVPLHRAVTTHGPLPEDALRTLTAGLAEALISVHGAGLIHRDLKPANVMLTLDGPRVIDFGISRAAEGTTLTRTGAVIGSVPYMSPEQTLGRALTPASDMFSLGSTVAFAALGSHLYGDGHAAGVGYRIVHTEPDIEAVPAILRPLIEACLAQDPGARPTPRQVVEHIEQVEHIEHIEQVERENRPLVSGSWLPGAVIADIIAVRGLMTALTREPPGQGPGPAPGARREPSAAGRRRLLLGVGGAVVSAVGAGVGLWLTKGEGGRSGGTGASGTDTGETGASGTDKGSTGADKGSTQPRRIRRPSGDVPEGQLAWKVNQSAASPQVLSANGVVACVSGEAVWGVDDKGDKKWTVDGDTGGYGMSFAVHDAMPKTVAAVDGGLLYVAGSKSLKSALAAIDMAKGEVVWTVALDRPYAQGVLSFWGIREGRAYLTGLGGDQGPAPKGYHVRALDLADRGTAWVHSEADLLIDSALPLTGDHVLFRTERYLKALDGSGKPAWEQKLAATLAATEKHVIVFGDRDTLYALDPATGDKVWSAEGAAEASNHGDGIATNKDGSLLYGLWQDEDGGHSLRCLDSATGTTQWQAPVPAGPKDAKGSGVRLLYGDGNLYWMASDAVVWAVDPAHGKARWKYTGLRGKNPVFLAWSAGDGRLCLSDPAANTVAALHANGA